MNLPFPRDYNFVGRKDVFTKIGECFRSSSTAALVGLGGMGKSQIAIEYAYRSKNKNCHLKTFWIRASSQDHLEQSFQTIAQQANLAASNDHGVNQIELVYTWLQQQNDPWLLIFDDLTQDVLSLYSQHLLRNDLRADSPITPQPSKGNMLLTTRDRDIAARISGTPNTLIPIPPLSETEAINLLQTKYPHHPTHPTSTYLDLARELDCIPLAISQALSYMGTQLSLPSYLYMLRSSPTILTLALDYEYHDPRRGKTASNSTLKTLWLSFEQARKATPSTFPLMEKLYTCHYRNIPLVSLLNAAVAADDDVEIAVQTLLDFSIIAPCEKDPGFFYMHRIVHLSLGQWLRLDSAISDIPIDLDIGELLNS